MLRAAARGGSACCELGGEKYVMTTLSVRQAQADEAAVVSGVLSEADAWLRTRGQPLWEPAQLMASELRAEVEAGKYIVCSEGDIVVGVARLTEDDLTFWPDAVEGEAFYVHRLALRRTHAGKGVSLALLDWSGKPALRFRFAQRACRRTTRGREVRADGYAIATWNLGDASMSEVVVWRHRLVWLYSARRVSSSFGRRHA